MKLYLKFCTLTFLTIKHFFMLLKAIQKQNMYNLHTCLTLALQRCTVTFLTTATHPALFPQVFRLYICAEGTHLLS